MFLVTKCQRVEKNRSACRRLDVVYDIFKEARTAKRWDEQRKCYLDPQGNPSVVLKIVNFEVLDAAIPTVREFYSKIKEDKNYEEEVEKRIKRVINASVEKSIETLKKSVVEIIDEIQKRMDEIMKKTSDKTIMADQTEVKIQTESTESSNKVKSVGNNDEIGKTSYNKNEV
ncbi:hypothetical protein Hanom_Chr10g00896141 [Helianthus anomalus]